MLIPPPRVQLMRVDVLLVRVVRRVRRCVERHCEGRDDGFATDALAALAALVLVVEPLDRAPNLRRLERGVTLAWDAGARPIVVLTKAAPAGTASPRAGGV